MLLNMIIFMDDHVFWLFLEELQTFCTHSPNPSWGAYTYCYFANPIVYYILRYAQLPLLVLQIIIVSITIFGWGRYD